MKTTLLVIALTLTTFSAHATQIVEFNSSNVVSYDLTQSNNNFKHYLTITYRDVNGGHSTYEKVVQSISYHLLNLTLHEMVTKKTLLSKNGSCYQQSLMLDTKSGMATTSTYSVKCK